MDGDDKVARHPQDDLCAFAEKKHREGIALSNIESMLIDRGVSAAMAANMVKNLATPDTTPRGFGNLSLDVWQVIRSNPFLFLVFPAIVWFPIDLLAERVPLTAGGGFLDELHAYNQVQRIPALALAIPITAFEGIGGKDAVWASWEGMWSGRSRILLNPLHVEGAVR